ncbi:hypothetical protein LLG95_16930 [bacterium]|nr:hypothetical protein [bacterium]
MENDFEGTGETDHNGEIEPQRRKDTKRKLGKLKFELLAEIPASHGRVKQNSFLPNLFAALSFILMRACGRADLFPESVLTIPERPII